MVPERMFFCFGICVGLLLGDAGLSEALLRPSAVRLKTTAVVVCADRLKWCSTSAVPLLCLSFLFLNFFSTVATCCCFSRGRCSCWRQTPLCGLRKRSRQSQPVKCCEQEVGPERSAQEGVWLKGSIVRHFSSHCCGKLSKTAWFTLETEGLVQKSMV